MPTYLAEIYAPVSEPGAPETAARLALIAESGKRARLVRSLFVPEDETCFLVLTATSMRAVRGLAERAGVSLERVVEVRNVDDESEGEIMRAGSRGTSAVPGRVRTSGPGEERRTAPRPEPMPRRRI